MADGIRMALDGSEDALQRLSSVLRRTDDAKGLFDAIGASLVVSTQDRFERETGPDGIRWPASLRALLSGGKTLTDTARLVQSMTHNASRDGVEVGTNVLYAAIHQLGGTIRPKTGKALQFRAADGRVRTVSSVTMPARPFLGLDEDDGTEIIAIAEDWLQAGIAPGSAGPR